LINWFCIIFSGCMLGKVLCLYLVLLLFLISVALYAWLSGMNIKTINIWRELTLGFMCLLSFATFFHFCNYAHYFANNVRYQKTLYEHIYIYLYLYIHIYIYGAFYFYYRLECKSRSFEKIMPPFTRKECSIPADGHLPNTVRTVTKAYCALGKLI